MSKLSNKNAEITRSALTHVAEGKTIWEINNWNNTNQVECLAEQANCIMTLAENVSSFCFFFKKGSHRSTNIDPVYQGAVSEDQWLSLKVVQVPSSRNDGSTIAPLGFGFTIKVTVDSLNEELQPTCQPVSGTFCNLQYAVHGSPSEAVVMDKFLQLSTTHKIFQSTSCYEPLRVQTDYTSQPATLRYGITVELFKCNEKLFLTTTPSISGGMETASNQQSSILSSILKDFDGLYGEDDNYADLKLQSKDGMLISAHKFVLAARSSLFRKIIEEETKRNDFSGTIKIVNVNAKPLMIMLNWLYCGKVSKAVPEEFLEELIVASEKYELKELLQLCEDEMIKVCNTTNMLGLFQLSKKFGMTAAIKYISDYIKVNIE